MFYLTNHQCFYGYVISEFVSQNCSTKDLSKILEDLDFESSNIRNPITFQVTFTDLKNGRTCFESRDDISITIQEYVKQSDQQEIPVPITTPSEKDERILYKGIVGPIKLEHNFQEITEMLKNGIMFVF